MKAKVETHGAIVSVILVSLHLAAGCATTAPKPDAESVDPVVACENLEEFGPAELETLRSLVDLEDPRLAGCFADRLQHPEHGPLTRQGLARIGTDETDEVLAAHLDALATRSYEWRPCEGAFETACADNPDSDGDGVPDAVEQRLRTDETNEDTDGDGIPDVRDRCPLLAFDREPRKSGPVVTALLTQFGTSDPGPMMVLRNQTPGICPAGLGSPILHVDEFPKQRPRGVVYGGYGTPNFPPPRQTSFTEGDIIYHLEEPYVPAEGNRTTVDFWRGRQRWKAVLVFRSDRWFVEHVYEHGSP